jgi:Ca-activated chloride channel homolog
MTYVYHRLLAAVLLLCAIYFAPLFAAQQTNGASPLSVQITAPLGRTGFSGAVRIVARVVAPAQATLSPIQFYVDGALIGEDKDGAPYAVEWLDDNPYAKREISVQVADSMGHTARDSVALDPLELTEETGVTSVLLEADVIDSDGRPANNLTQAHFQLLEDDVAQTLDSVNRDEVPTTYTLLVDSSQSMAHRMDFVRSAAHELPIHLKKDDRIVVAPFSKTLHAVTGPTLDRQTIAGAIDAIRASGGTAILDSLVDATKQLKSAGGRNVVVVITDGYDENSMLRFNEAVEEIKQTQATVYVVAIGGVAGISIRGRDLLNRITKETGGKAFFPLREFQLTELSKLVAADVQARYLISYTPTNQKPDGTWRTIKLTTTDPSWAVSVRPGYRAPLPPPIRPNIELIIRDVNRQFVDVAAADLEVIEDGVTQKIEAFEEAVAPMSVLLVLDASGSMKRDAEQVMAAARSFVTALPQRDKLGVLMFADKAEFEQDLSLLRDWSLAAINEYKASGGTALHDALLMAIERLRPVEGRRVVVALTDGRDENNPGTGPGSIATFDDVVASLRNSGVTVFAIGLGEKVDRQPLETLAQMSGGEAYFPQDVSLLAADYHRVLENLRRRYIIRYTSSNVTRDGAWRNVEVRPRRSGLVVETQGGYFAPAQ